MRLKRTAAVMIGSVLIFGSLPYSVLAKDEANTEKGDYFKKDEAIYGKLKSNGTLKNMYVVNTFHGTKAGSIIDYGDYKDVRNLSNLKELKQVDDQKVRFEAEKNDKDFYYQGDLKNKELPWDIDITYKLNGKKIDPKKLSGKDGTLQLEIKTSGNPEANAEFFENYMLQISVALDPVHFDKIQAPDANKAKSGKDTMLTFTVMPEKKETFIVSAEVSNLEMDPIEVSATPASIPFDDPDISGVKGDIQSLSDAIKKVNHGVGDLKGGIAELNNGAADLKNGSNSYLNGINQLNNSSDELVNGSSEINSALKQVSGALEDVPDVDFDTSDLKQLPGGIRELANGLTESADGIDTLRENYNAANNGLEEAMEAIPSEEITEEQINEILKNEEVDEEVVNQLVESYHVAQQAKETYNSTKEAFDSVTGTLEDASKPLREMAKQANATATEVENGLKNLDIDGLGELEDLQKGIQDMASQYQTFHNGLVQYTDGVGELATNYKEINNGIGELSNGAGSLENGAGELQNGTDELEKETSDLPNDMQSEIDELLEEFDTSDFEPISFVSEKNKDVDVVQFVLQTDPIKKEEPKEVKKPKKEKKGFWERLLDLF